MPGAREALEAEDVVADDTNVLLWHGYELAPEPVERVAVEPAGARFEPGRIVQVGRAHGRDVDLERGMLTNDRSRGAGMVEMDVGEQEVADVAELEAAGGEAVLQRREAGGRPTVEERRAVVGLDEVAANVAREALVEEVDRGVVAGHHA